MESTKDGLEPTQGIIEEDDDPQSSSSSTDDSTAESASVEVLKVKVVGLVFELNEARKTIQTQQRLIADLKAKLTSRKADRPESTDGGEVGGGLDEFFASIGLPQYAAVFAKEEFDVDSVMLLDETELKDMDIPRGPRLKILNRIKGGPSTPSSLDSPSSSSERTAFTPSSPLRRSDDPQHSRQHLSPLELGDVVARKKKNRLSWGVSQFAGEGEGSPLDSSLSSSVSLLSSSSSSLSLSYAEPHQQQQDLSSSGGGTLMRKIKRNSAELRRKMVEVRSPGRPSYPTFHNLSKKSISDLEEQMSASDGSVLTRAQMDQRRRSTGATRAIIPTANARSSTYEVISRVGHSDDSNDEGPEEGLIKKVMLVEASAPIKTVKKMAITDILPKVSQMAVEKQKPKKVGGVVYEYYFTGTKLIEWLLEESLATTPMDALMVCSLLLQSGVIVALAKNKDFEGKHELYALEVGDARDKRTRSVTYATSPVNDGSPKANKKEKKEKKKKEKEEKKEKKKKEPRRPFSLRKSGMAILNGIKQAQAEEKAYEGANNQLRRRVFKSTLDEVMALQQESDPTLQVPRILVELRRAIVNNRGHQTMGVFRISGNNERVIELVTQLNEGEYDVLSDVDDVHILATILKRWIRDLAEPLIPADLYYAAIDIVKSDGYRQPERCWEALVGVPALNQRVIIYVLDFLRDLARPEYSAVTKMDVDNLSMVFAPLFLCCPDSSLLFSNSVYEATFVQNLLTSDPSPASTQAAVPSPSAPAVTLLVSAPPSQLSSSPLHAVSPPSSPALPVAASPRSSLTSSSSSVLLPLSGVSPSSSPVGGLPSAFAQHSPSILRARRSVTPRAASPTPVE
jgi:hypothetical protein